jgi:hypothetical protein
MQIDHVVIAVNDLDAAASKLRELHGLIALSGGTHPTGTENRVIPLKPPQYIELLGVGQEELLRSHQFGERLLYTLARGDSLLTFAVRADDISAVSVRLSSPVFPGEWHGPDGAVGRWRNVFPEISEFDSLPFFIQYDETDAARREAAYATASSPAEPGAIARIQVRTDRSRLLEWVGDDSLPLVFADSGPTGIQAVAIESSTGEIIIRNEDL